MEDPNFTKNVRVRFAPSPTGWMHIGSLRNVLFNYIWAKKNDGKFILRVEDTDVNRTVDKGVESIYETFNAFGMEVDEGPNEGGDFGPYIQSDRVKDGLYKKYAEQLVEQGDAYYCFCSEDRLAKLRESQIAKKQQPRYDRTCRDLSIEEAKERVLKGEPYVIRLKFPLTGFTEYQDVVHGRVRIKNSIIDDQVLLKTDGYPTYIFAVVVDDHLMEISHIIRGDEYVSSTPKLVKLYEALGWDLPYLVQTPNVLNPDGKKKLSKRGGSNAAVKFLRKGYLLPALWNFLVLQGWSPSDSDGNPDEIYSMDELIKLFDLRRVKRAGARFLPDKLDHFNGVYIRRLTVTEFADAVLNWAKESVVDGFISDKVLGFEDWEERLISSVNKYLPIWQENRDLFEKQLSLIQERVKYLSEIPELLEFFYIDQLQYSIEDFNSLDYPDVAQVLKESWGNLKKAVDDLGWGQEGWEASIRNSADQLGWKHGDMFMLIRIAVTGKRQSPPLRECMELMDLDKCDRAVNSAVSFLESN